MQVAAGIVHRSNHLLLFLKRAMKFGDRVAVVGSETKVYQVQYLSTVSIRVIEKKIFWLDVAMDNMSRVHVHDNVQLPVLEPEDRVWLNRWGRSVQID